MRQETIITIHEDWIEIEYWLQLNRPGAYLEVLRMDTNADGELSAQEQGRYFARFREMMLGGLEVRVNDEEVPLEQIGKIELAMPFTKRYRFKVVHPPTWREGAVVEYHNDNFLDAPGEITVTLDAGDAADIVYDSRWNRGEEAAAPRDRDVVFRYRAGTGRQDPRPGWKPAEPAAPREATSKPLTVTAAGAVMLAVVLTGGAVILSIVPGRPVLRIVVSAAAVLVPACLVVVPYTALGRRVAVPDHAEAGQVFRRLHREIYRAFEASTESEIYDTLAGSLEGELLDEVYNEVYEALMMRSGGQTRFDIRRVKPLSTRVLPADDVAPAAFRVRYRWRVYGTVTHFGHTHARFNEYEALYVVRHNGQAWRIANAEVRQHKRLRRGMND